MINSLFYIISFLHLTFNIYTKKVVVLADKVNLSNYVTSYVKHWTPSALKVLLISHCEVFMEPFVAPLHKMAAITRKHHHTQTNSMLSALIQKTFKVFM